MNRSFHALLLAAALTLAACGGSTSSTADAAVAEYENIADALESVNDEESARAAARRIAAANAELEEIAKTFEEMSDMEKAMAAGRMAQGISGVQARIGAAMAGIAQRDRALYQTISDEMNRLPTLE